MRLYIRKDVVASIWKYGVAPVTAPPKVDPYAAGKINLQLEEVELRRVLKDWSGSCRTTPT